MQIFNLINCFKNKYFYFWINVMHACSPGHTCNHPTGVWQIGCLPQILIGSHAAAI